MLEELEALEQLQVVDDLLVRVARAAVAGLGRRRHLGVGSRLRRIVGRGRRGRGRGDRRQGSGEEQRRGA